MPLIQTLTNHEVIELLSKGPMPSTLTQGNVKNTGSISISKEGGLRFGPAPHVLDNNPKWVRPQAPKGKKKPTGSEDNLPMAYPLDLYHLSQQDFAQDTAKLKRWFLTAFVAPEDQHLLALPSDISRIPTIAAKITEIQAILNKPPAIVGARDIAALKQNLCELFTMESWLGVGLQHVDDGKMSIDMLNTLIQWQAGIKQFGEQYFSLSTSVDNHTKIGTVPSTLHEIIVGNVTLDIEAIKASEWGQINDAEAKAGVNKLDWKGSIEDFEHVNVLQFTTVDKKQGTLNIQLPSSEYLSQYLLHHDERPSFITPLYSLGYLAYEDFEAAAFFGGRPMQAYLPGSNNNLYRAHNSYYGEALITQHDYAHATAYRDTQRHEHKQDFVRSLRLKAIISNALVRGAQDAEDDDLRENDITLANRTIDSGDSISLSFRFDFTTSRKKTQKAFTKQVKKLLCMFYNEFACAAGIALDEEFTAEQTGEDKYMMKGSLNGQWVSFSIHANGDNFNQTMLDFSEHFEQMQKMNIKPKPIQLDQPSYIPAVPESILIDELVFVSGRVTPPSPALMHAMHTEKPMLQSYALKARHYMAPIIGSCSALYLLSLAIVPAVSHVSLSAITLASTFSHASVLPIIAALILIGALAYHLTHYAGVPCNIWTTPQKEMLELRI